MKRNLKERFIYPTDLAEFSDPPRQRVRRLIPAPIRAGVEHRRQNDQAMMDAEEEEKKEE